MGQIAPRAAEDGKMEYDLDEWEIYIADCYASNKKRPAGLHGQDITVTAEQLVCNVFLRHTWYLGTHGMVKRLIMRRYIRVAAHT